MNNNYGGSNQTGADQQPVIASTQNQYSNVFSRKNNNSDRLNIAHSDEIEDKIVAKTLGELDADILQAMENLSITEEDIKSSNSSDQNDSNSEEIKGNL